MKYEDIINDICGDEWLFDSSESINGGYGVAMMLAFLEGVAPKIDIFSRDLQIPKELLLDSYNNLLKSGMFSKNFNAKNDPVLKGLKFSVDSNYRVEERLWTIEKASVNAWCHIAAVASGVIDRNIPKTY